MNYKEIAIMFLTQLLGVAAGDSELTSEEYQAVCKFIGREIGRLRMEGDRNEQSKEG